jgi:hypothetical protein
VDSSNHIAAVGALRDVGGDGGVVLALVRHATTSAFHANHCAYSFLVIKVILGVNLVSYAAQRRAGMEARAAADVVNDFGRNPIGEGKEEQVRFFFACGCLIMELTAHFFFYLILNVGVQ